MTEQSAASTATAAPAKVEVSDAFIEALVAFDAVDQEEAVADLAEKHGPEYEMIARAKLRRRLRPSEALDDLRLKSAEGAQDDLQAAAADKRAEQQARREGRVVLNPNAPYDIAAEYINRRCTVDGHCVLWFWQDSFYFWSGRVYEALPNDVLRGQMYDFLHQAFKRSGGNTVPYEPDSRKVNEVIDALKSRLSLGSSANRQCGSGIGRQRLSGSCSPTRW